MSRIGKKPVVVPKEVQVVLGDNLLTVIGPKGKLTRQLHHTMNINMDSDQIIVTPKQDIKAHRKFHGLTRSLIANMVEGVSQGFKKSLYIVGTGWKANIENIEKNAIELLIGYSHPVKIGPVPGITFEVDKNRVPVPFKKQGKLSVETLHILGASKEDVGETAAQIRRLRPPNYFLRKEAEKYTGPGLRYIDECNPVLLRNPHFVKPS